MIDFTSCVIDTVSHYGGSDQKRGIIYNGERYMLKLSDRIGSDERNPLNSSYSNSVYSEHISCNIIKMMNLPVQDTLLGSLTTKSAKYGTKTTPVVACRNFVPQGYELVEFKNIENSLLFHKPGKIPKIVDLYEILTTENMYFSKDFGKAALERYWDTFIIDALLGNFDRHANNWGYLVSQDNKDIQLAPIYDCGSCLYPQLSDDAIPGILADQEQIVKRVDQFPTAALELENGKKVNYKEYIHSLINDDCNRALKRIVPLIDLQKIAEYINGLSELSEIRKVFYITMLEKRFEYILKPAYDRAAV